MKSDEAAVFSEYLFMVDYFGVARHSANVCFAELVLLLTRISCAGRSVAMVSVSDELGGLKCLPITSYQKGSYARVPERF